MSSFPHFVGHVTGHSYPSFPTGPDMDTNDHKDQNMHKLFLIATTSFHWDACIRHPTAIAILSFWTLHVISITFGRAMERTFISIISNWS